MQRRNLLIGMGSIAAGGAATIGTGAVNSVTATRTVNIDTTNDANAYLSMDPTAGENSQYASFDGQNTVELDLNSVNRDAKTTMLGVFQVTNTGDSTLLVYVPPNNGVSPNSVGPDRSFPSPGDGGGNVYVDPQASGMPNEPQPFSLTGVYGSSLPPAIVDYAGQNSNVGSTSADNNNTGSDENPGTSIYDRQLGPGEAFQFGLNIQHEAPAEFPEDMSVTLAAIEKDLIM